MLKFVKRDETKHIPYSIFVTLKLILFEGIVEITFLSH